MTLNTELTHCLRGMENHGETDLIVWYLGRLAQQYGDLLLPCDYCHSVEGQQCTKPNGQPAETTHRPRVLAIEALHQRANETLSRIVEDMVSEQSLGDFGWPLDEGEPKPPAQPKRNWLGWLR